MRISILLVDDHTIVRQGLRALLTAEPDFRIVAEAENGIDALKLVDTYLPDVVVLDLVMNGVHGLEVVRQIKNRHPEICVVILSMYDTEAYVQAAIKNGASGYVLKGSDARELIQAIKLVVQSDEFYLSPPLSEAAIDGN